MNPFLITGLFASCFFCIWLYLIAPRRQSPVAFRQLQGWKYAHRGLHDRTKGVPENSLLAFQHAKEQGFAIELDVHLSKDGRLVVEHDDNLLRPCGIQGTIEDMPWSKLQNCRLEGTDQRLPLLEEVLALIDGAVPLLIEAKVFRGNQKLLCPALWRALSCYHGPYCVESFDPRALFWFRRNAPTLVRGQLAAYVRKDGAKIAPIIDFVLRNLLVNVLSRPDFISYNYLDRHNLSFWMCRHLFHAPIFFWTIRSAEGAHLASLAKASPIFEEINL